MVARAGDGEVDEQAQSVIPYGSQLRGATRVPIQHHLVDFAEQTLDMGPLLVVTGPPGSGKSTVSKLLVEQRGPSALVEGDQFFAFLARDAIEPWLPKSHQQNTVVVDAAAAATGRFTDGGFFTVYDGVVGPWFIDAFVSAAGLTELDYVVLMPDIETCVARVLGRSGHGFRDEAATRRMHAEFAAAIVESRHVLRIGSEPVAEVGDRITAAMDAGHLRYSLTTR